MNLVVADLEVLGPQAPQRDELLRVLALRSEKISLLIAADTSSSWRDKRLYIGGGMRDGSAGFVQVVDANTGELGTTYELPARVTECGLAAAEGRLFVCYEDGTLVCLAR